MDGPGGTDPHLGAWTRTGWREWVSLPALGVDWLKAKIDTGARTSSLHAFDLEHEREGGELVARFTVRPWQASEDDPVPVTCPVLDERAVRSSSGHAETRLVVGMRVRLVHREIDAEVTLSRRDEMDFRMLVGREALAQGFLVDPSASYVGGRPPLAVRRRNRGR